MARRKIIRADRRVTRHKHQDTRQLITLRADHAIWDRSKDCQLFLMNVSGSLVRLEPPADSTPDDISHAEAVLIAAGAIAVRKMQQVAQQGTQGPAGGPQTVRTPDCLRKRVMARAGALRGVRDLSDLETILDTSLTAAGL